MEGFVVLLLLANYSGSRRSCGRWSRSATCRSPWRGRRLPPSLSLASKPWGMTCSSLVAAPSPFPKNYNHSIWPTIPRKEAPREHTAAGNVWCCFCSASKKSKKRKMRASKCNQRIPRKSPFQPRLTPQQRYTLQPVKLCFQNQQHDPRMQYIYFILGLCCACVYAPASGLGIVRHGDTC